MKSVADEDGERFEERGGSGTRGGAKGARAGALRRFQRLWATRKGEAVVRLLGGEDPNALAREHGVTVTDLMVWKEKFIQASIDGLKRRELDGSQERGELRAKVGELTMELELYRKNVRRRAAREGTRGERYRERHLGPALPHEDGL